MAHKQLSRQRLWQIKKQAAGRCQICGKKEVVSGYCQKHKKARQERYAQVRKAEKA